jgi:plasmid stabilization system protein ParE
MALRINITPAALDDLQSGIDYYNTQKKGLGKRFLERIHNSLTRIRENPLAASIAYNDVRYKVIETFPYVILYNVNDDRIIILRVFNTHLQPK